VIPGVQAAQPGCGQRVRLRSAGLTLSSFFVLCHPFVLVRVVEGKTNQPIAWR